MFEAAEIGHKLSKGQFKRIEPKLRAELLDAQFDLSKNGRFPVVILISGVRGAGKGETVNLLNEWMDPRHIHTHAFDSPSDEESERPPMWRYWRTLPPKGWSLPPQPDTGAPHANALRVGAVQPHAHSPATSPRSRPPRRNPQKTA